MPAPTINPTVSIQAWTVGRYAETQPSATHTPTSWAAVNLPPGLAINTSTGRITGTPTAPGFYNVKLTATNGDGTSTAVYVAFGVEANPLGSGVGIPINVELETGFVTGPFAAAAEWAVYAKSGDLKPLLIGFTLGGELQPVPLALLRVGLKQYESETLITLNDGAEFETLGSYDTTRFRLLANFDSDTLANWLADYEDDTGTHFTALMEIEAVILEEAIGGGDPLEAPFSSQTFRCFIERQMIPEPA